MARQRGSPASLPDVRRSLVAALRYAAIALVLGATPVRAGAFNLPAGQGLAIMDVTLSEGSRYFNGLGRLARADEFRRGDASVYVEYGVTDWLMAVIRPDLTAVSLDGHPGGHYAGLGPSQAGAQIQVLAFGPAVFAVSGSFQLPGSTDTRNRALLGNTSRDADLRGLFGYTFAIGDWPAFIDAQGAYRLRDSGAPDEIHTDLTLGVRVLDDLLFLVQAFNTTGLGRGSAWFPRKRYTQIELAAVYDLDAAWSVEVGAYTTVLGEQSLRENGLQTAVWYRF